MAVVNCCSRTCVERFGKPDHEATLCVHAECEGCGDLSARNERACGFPMCEESVASQRAQTPLCDGWPDTHWPNPKFVTLTRVHSLTEGAP